MWMKGKESARERRLREERRLDGQDRRWQRCSVLLGGGGHRLRGRR